jgi:hypothetical protein
MHYDAMLPAACGAALIQRFCEANRFSYWEGIEELMNRAGGYPSDSASFLVLLCHFLIH